MPEYRVVLEPFFSDGKWYYYNIQKKCWRFGLFPYWKSLNIWSPNSEDLKNLIFSLKEV